MIVPWGKLAGNKDNVVISYRMEACGEIWFLKTTCEDKHGGGKNKQQNIVKTSTNETGVKQMDKKTVLH